MAALPAANCLAPDAFTRLFTAALSVLEEVARTSPNPAERRRAATAILRYLFARTPKADRPTPTSPTPFTPATPSAASPSKLARPELPHAPRRAASAPIPSTPPPEPPTNSAPPRATLPPTTPPAPLAPITTSLRPAATLLANFAASHSPPPLPSLALWPFAIWPFATPATFPSPRSPPHPLPRAA